MHRRLLIALGAVVCSLIAVSPATYAEHAWGTYHWARTSNPFPLQVVDSVTADWQTELEDTLQAWSDSEVLNLAITSANDANRTRKRCPMVKGQVRVCNASYGFNGWLGLATIGINPNGHIDRGTAKVNDSYASYWTDPAEKNHVMCQEAGHLLGLGHTSEDGTSQQTCMDYSMNPASQWPNEHDYAQLMDIYYTHTDTYNSYDDGSGDGESGCNAPPGKGCNKANGVVPLGVLVHHGPGHELWVAPRFDGGLWVHHIRLAPVHL